MTATTFRCLQMLGMLCLLGGMVLAAEPELLKQPERDPPAPAPTTWIEGLTQWLSAQAPAGKQLPGKEYPPKENPPPKRDPFATTPEMLKQATGGPQLPGGPALPSLRLKGLATDRNGAVAILEADGTSVVFVRPGDVVNISTKNGTATIPFKILKIERDSMLVEIGDTGRMLVVR
ncbi:MAG: hypothetical protein AB7K24_10420 [Gemmataceae bacterium]